jgi:hypothetical protein
MYLPPLERVARLAYSHGYEYEYSRTASMDQIGGPAAVSWPSLNGQKMANETVCFMREKYT